MDMETAQDKKQESRVRSVAKRLGYSVRRSRRGFSVDNLGEFRVVDVQTNGIVMGERFDASLDDIETFLRE